MAYTVLARRYRSQNFDDVVGQDAVAQTLRNAIESGRVAHAYLFCGTRGVGKTTLARVLAKSLNCLEADGPTVDPCCKCDSCVSVNLGEDIDVIEIDGASNTGVDNIRQLRQNAIYRPARARYKIYIIDEVHMLSTGAFNALLKILEEPPEHVKFIFATTEPNKVLATIQSRCQRFDFSSIGPTVISEQLRKILNEEGLKFTDDLLLHLARLANGSMRDALSLLDQLISAGEEPLTVELLEEFLGQPNRQKLCRMIELISDSDSAGVLTSIDEMLNGGQTPSQIVDALIDYMRDLMVIRSTGGKSEILILTDDERKQMSALAEKFDIASIIYNITTLEKLRWTIKNSDTPRALLEASVLRLTLSEHFVGIEKLLARLNTSGGQGPASKKKVTPAANSTNYSSAPAAGSDDISPEQDAPPVSIEVVADGSTLGLEGIKGVWSKVTDSIGATGVKFAGYLKRAEVAEWDSGTMVLAFPESAKFIMDMCQKKAGEIGSAIGAALAVNVNVKFKVCSSIETKTETRSAGARPSREKRQEALDDPAIKTLLSGLDATVVQIENADKKSESSEVD